MSTDVSRGPRARRDPAPARRTPAPPAGDLIDSPRFQEAVKGALANEQQRANLRHATTTIRNKRAQVVAELDNWQELRQAGEQIKTRVGRHMPDYLLQFEENFTKAGGVIHWARDAEEANQIVIELVRQIQKPARRHVIGADDVGVEFADQLGFSLEGQILIQF